MKHIVLTAAMMVAVLVASAAWAGPNEANAAVAAPAPPVRPERFTLVDASPTIDALLARVLEALADKDEEALHRLRVTESEYRSFVIPGSAKPGTEPQVLPEKDSEFFWQMLDTNSRYAAGRVIRGWGGKRYTLKSVEYAKGHKEYLWYDAYKTAVLTLEDEEGKKTELALGAIAHIDGQYKFVGLAADR
jgi:hypothetical protein